MTARRHFLAACLGALLVASAALPSGASSASDLPNGSIPGLIVALKPNAQLSAFDYVASSRGLGNNLYALNFSHPTSISFANRILKNVSGTPEVLSVSLDQPIRPTIQRTTVRSANPVLVSKAIRASAPRSLRARDLATQTQLGAAQIRWQKPSTLAGGKLAYYELSISQNAGSSFFSTQRVGPAGTKQTITNLTPGRKYLVRLAAVVKRGGKYYRGKSSSVSTITTALPRPPVLTSPARVFAPSVVTWLKQSNYQTGGLPVTYSVALASGTESVIACTTSANLCNLTAPVNPAGYRITVTATTARGSASSLISAPRQDALLDQQWSLNGQFGINAPNAWSVSSGGPTVAVVDSGITEHPDLSGSLVRAANGKPYGFDFVTDLDASADGDGWDADPSDPGDFGPTVASSWHGTSVAGLIGAAHNSIGIAGVAPSSPLVSVRAVGSKGGKVSDLLAAVNWAAGVTVPNAPFNEHPAKIINISMASEVDFSCESAARTTFSSLRQRGVIVVTAAGNRGVDASKSFPASCSTVLVVAASTYDGAIAEYSNNGRRIDIAAPGGEVNYLNPPLAQGLMTTSNTGLKAPEASSYRMASGTSLSTPLVTGVVALMLAVNPDLTPARVKSILRSTVRPFASNSYCRTLDICGPGIVDAAAAIELAAIYNW